VCLSTPYGREVIERAAALEARSEHPLARAILKRAKEEGIASVPAEDFRIVAGKGAEGRIADRRFWIGSHRFMDERGETPEVQRASGTTGGRRTLGGRLGEPGSRLRPDQPWPTAFAWASATPCGRSGRSASRKWRVLHGR